MIAAWITDYERALLDILRENEAARLQIGEALRIDKATGYTGPCEFGKGRVKVWTEDREGRAEKMATAADILQMVDGMTEQQKRIILVYVRALASGDRETVEALDAAKAAGDFEQVKKVSEQAEARQRLFI